MISLIYQANNYDMGKRMTEPEKWRDPWFRSLTPEQKLVFLFLIDQCDWGGFYEIDTAYMSFCIGLPESSIEGAFKGLARGCVVVDGWVWIRNFLKHQKNEKLNPANNAHKNIIDRINEQLIRFSNVPDFSVFIGAYKGLISPIGKGKGKGNGKGKGSGKSYSESFEKFWEKYPRKEGKGNAFESWESNGLNLIFDRVLQTLEKYNVVWQDTEKKFIPHPSTWLNQKRYDDEPEKSKAIHNATGKPNGRTAVPDPKQFAELDRQFRERIGGGNERTP